ncbi:hypothetical protein BB14905_08728 [Bacillus sp. B14905]|nr:hypothetical protein BB14905_08728 [Bacillus sp. B14905]
MLAEDRNHVSGGDHTQHPEFALARWAAKHMSAKERSITTVYTSGEHCPMCAAHMVGLGCLGRIVYASSSKQLAQWLKDMGITTASRVRHLSIQEVIRDTPIDGPAPELAEQVHQIDNLIRNNIEQSSDNNSKDCFL